MKTISFDLVSVRRGSNSWSVYGDMKQIPKPNKKKAPWLGRHFVLLQAKREGVYFCKSFGVG